MSGEVWAVIAQSDLPKSMDLVTVCNTEERAHILSAAKDGLNACGLAASTIRNHLDNSNGSDGDLRRLRDALDACCAALAKARGKTP